MKIAALVSGGVDSSVVVHLLKEAGYDPTLFYIRIGMEDKDKTLHCHSEEDIEIVSYTARKYGCRLEVCHGIYPRLDQTRLYPQSRCNVQQIHQVRFFRTILGERFR